MGLNLREQKIGKTTLQPNKRRSVQKMTRKNPANSRKLHDFETWQK